jgi:hypothetical protein
MNFSPAVVKAAFAGVTVAGMTLGAVAGLAWEAGAETLGSATERDGAAGELAVPGTELLLGFVGTPAACLHPSDSESLCSLRQATIRPHLVALPRTASQFISRSGRPPFLEMLVRIGGSDLGLGRRMNPGNSEKGANAAHIRRPQDEFA